MQFGILNTRPVHQAPPLTAAVEQAGGFVFHMPLFTIEPVDFPSIDLSQFSYFIFVSRNAVDAFFNTQAVLPVDTQVIAIGSATLTALHDNKIEKVICPSEFNSESVLSLRELQDVAHKKIAIICGENTKQLLGDSLSARAASVTYIECYRRKKINYNMDEWFPKLIKTRLNFIVVTSLESYFALLLLFNKKAHRSWLMQKTICVIHDKMSQQAKQDGFARIVLANNPTPNSIVEAIKESVMSEKSVITTHSSVGAYWVSAVAVMISIGAILVSVWNFQSSLENKMDRKSQGQEIQLIQSALSQLQKTQNSELTYLVHLANMQLVVGHDPAAALKTLQFAEKQISPEQIGINSALNDDIAKLQAVAIVDKGAVFSDIASLNQSIQSLSAIPSKPVNPIVQAVPQAVVQKTWRDHLQGFLSDLKKLFIIRRVNDTVTPLFDAQLEFSVKQNIYLQLSLAQTALLHHDEKVYLASLKAVENSLSRYFSLTNEAKPILDKLTALEKINVDPALPSLEDTMILLSKMSVGATTVSAAPIQQAAPVKNKNMENKPVSKIQTGVEI